MSDQQEFRKALERGQKGAIDHAVAYYPRSLEAGRQEDRIAELETQNKILSDSIMAGTNVYKRKLAKIQAHVDKQKADSDLWTSYPKASGLVLRVALIDLHKAIEG